MDALRSQVPPTLGPVSNAGFYQDHTLGLGPWDLRVLHLHAGSDDDVVSCTLERRELPPLPSSGAGSRSSGFQEPDFDVTALSYEWGSGTRGLRTIRCNNEAFGVTRNLHSALRHLRRPHSHLTLWVDAICINQGDGVEKNGQVQRMGEIYRRARRTVVWLGDAGFWTRAAFDECLRIAAPDEAPRSRWRALSDPFAPFLVLLLLRRSYFTRIWIVQEIALSHDLEIACGDSRLPWRHFVTAVSANLLTGAGSSGTRAMGNILVARALLPWTPTDGPADPAWRYQTLTRETLPQSRDILSMAALFRNSKATVPADKLFGLLGLCQQSGDGRGTYGITADYLRGRNQVYISASRAILTAQLELYLFSAVNRRPPRSQPSRLWSRLRAWGSGHRYEPPLPTWVPDWSDHRPTATPLSLILRQKHSAGAGFGGNGFELGLLQTGNAQAESTVRMSGTHVDTIADLGIACNTEHVQRGPWFCLRFALTMSEHHRLEVFSAWERRFRNPDPRFWDELVDVATCGNTGPYEEDVLMPLIARFRTRSPLRLPTTIRTIFAGFLVGPIAIHVAAWTLEGLVVRILLYWCFPVLCTATMWWCCFQLVPNTPYRRDWDTLGTGNEGFLRREFDHMELRRLARLRSGKLALVPEASQVGDQVWACRGGIVPLVLRPTERDGLLEMVGECYSSSIQQGPKPSRPTRLISLV